MNKIHNFFFNLIDLYYTQMLSQKHHLKRVFSEKKLNLDNSSANIYIKNTFLNADVSKKLQ